MDLFVTKKPGLMLEVIYARSAAHAHRIRAQERGESVETADASFDLAAWQVIDSERIEGHRMLVWERTEYGEVEDGWDYSDWCGHGAAMAEEEGREGASIASCMPADLDGLLVPATA